MEEIELDYKKALLLLPVPNPRDLKNLANLRAMRFYIAMTFLNYKNCQRKF